MMPFLKNQALLFSSFLLLNPIAHAQKPMWTIEPAPGNNPRQVIQNNVSIDYLVTNNSKKSRQLTMLPIQGVQPSAPCFLAPRGQLGSQCTLSLAINSNNIQKSGIHGGPILCQMDNNGTPNTQQCYRPSAENSLDISHNALSQAKRITVGGYVDALNEIYPLAYYSLDNGQSWTSSQIPATLSSSFLRAVTCDETGTHCIALATSPDPTNLSAAAIVSEDGGQTWVNSAPILPYQGYMTELTSIACDAAGLVCVAMGGYKIDSGDQYTLPVSYTSNDGGKNWTVSPSLPALAGQGGEIRDMYCNKTASRCLGVGTYYSSRSRAIIYVTNDQGATWSTPSLPAAEADQNLDLASVSCDQSELNCFAGGRLEPYNALSSKDGGETWTSYTVPTYTEEDTITYFSCEPNSALCALAVGDKEGDISPASFVSTDIGMSWAGPSTIISAIGQTIFLGISCRQNTCLSVGNYAEGLWIRKSQDGLTWNAPILTNPSTAVISLLYDVF